jgi:pyrimidine-nucleoside phosphorylase
LHIKDIIRKKKRGLNLTEEEINFFVQGYVKGDIPDYQAASLLMAIWFQGMTREEMFALTQAMLRSGDTLDLSSIPGVKVDKHSTGGVADTTTLVIGPVVAACGGKMAKISGRGLGHTGGTLDKLESIPGFNVNLNLDVFKQIVSRVGFSVIGQMKDLVPADKKLYALRDVTETVDHISLIASSIMSKKLASGCDAVVLDVKTGNGAFIQDDKEAVKLAQIMVDIGDSAGKKIAALVTDMNQPLGTATGNALEVKEAINILQNKINPYDRRGDLKKACLALAGEMLLLSDIFSSKQEAEEAIKNSLENGAALAKFAEMIEQQGGNPKVTENSKILPKALRVIPVKAEKKGFIGSMKTQEIGEAASLLGAGRRKKTDKIDPAVGVWMRKRIGDTVERGEEVALFHVNSEQYLEEAVNRFKQAVEITEEEPQVPQLIYKKIKPAF